MNNHREAIVLLIVLFSIAAFAGNLRAGDSLCVSMHNGKVMMMENGKATVPLTSSITMSNGTVVMPDGSVKMKDGTQKHMKEGQMIMLDGHIMQGSKSNMGVDAN
jgi:hypothetical protein